MLMQISVFAFLDVKQVAKTKSWKTSLDDTFIATQPEAQVNQLSVLFRMSPIN